MTRTKYREQIHVSGEYGTETFRRDDEPDYGDGDIDRVVSFDGVVEFRNEAVIGVGSFDERAADEFIDSIDGRVSEYEVHTFEVEEGS